MRKLVNHKLLPILIAFALSFIAFGFSLANDLVFDDRPLLIQNNCHQGISKIPAMFDFSHPTRCTIRPLRSASLAFDYSLFSGATWGYHLSNLLLHALVGYLVFIVASMLGFSKIAAWIAMIFMLIHPLNSEAVVYVSGRRDLLAAFFSLSAIVCFLSFLNREKIWKFPIVIFFFVAALFSHEITAALPLALLVITLALDNDFYRALKTFSLNKLFRLKTSYILFTLFFVALIFSLWKIGVTNPSQKVDLWGETIWGHVGTVLRVHMHYLRLVLFPEPLVADYSESAFRLSMSLLEWQVVLAFLLLTIIFVLLIWYWRKDKRISALGLSYFLLLLPVSQIFIHHELLAEHRLYLPLIMIALIAGYGFDRAIQVVSFSRFVLGMIALLLIVQSNIRTTEWKNSYTLWKKTVEQVPKCARANANYARALIKRNQIAEARDYLKRALLIKPSLCAARANLGDVLIKLKKTQEGITWVKKAECLGPLRYRLRYGYALLSIGDAKHALEQFRLGLKANPTNARIIFGLAMSYELIGDDQQAIENYKRALKYKAKWKMPLFYLGRQYAKACQRQKAIFYWQKLEVVVKPSDPLLKEAQQAFEKLKLCPLTTF